MSLPHFVSRRRCFPSSPWTATAAFAVLCCLTALAEASDCPQTCQLRTSCESYTPFAVSLRWLKSAQFAGFYAAKALGFWEDECLSVSLRPPAFTYNAVKIWELPDDTRATIPHYRSFLLYYLTYEKQVFHVSQYFRRAGKGWWTSPVNNPERTLNITGFSDLRNVVLCAVGNVLDVDTSVVASIAKHNKTACNYIDAFTRTLVECRGTEDIRFTKCGFGVEEVLGISEQFEPAHVMHGMFYDQLGQMLTTVADGRLYKVGVDFQVFSFAEDDIIELEDGIMVNKTWVQDPESEETLVRFLKGLHKGWIYCRDNPDHCVDLVAPHGMDPLMKMHQRFQMHEINKLIWPAPGGIGVHSEHDMQSVQDVALFAGLINKTVPFAEHTSDKYVLLANQRLVEEGYDVEGLHFTQPAFQRRLEFCLDDNEIPRFCTSSEFSAEEPKLLTRALLIAVAACGALVTVAVLVMLIWIRRTRSSPGSHGAAAKRNPPGLLGNGRPVTIAVTDIQDSTKLWAKYPEEMMAAQAQHDKCLRKCLSDCHGYEVKTEGDSFTVAFHEADDALKWCSQVQVSLQSLSWPEKLISGESLNGTELPASSSSTSLWKAISDPCQRHRDRPAECAPEILDFYEEADAAKNSKRQGKKFGSCFNGLRVRMGVHTGPVSDIYRHPVTKRVIYDEALVTKAKLVSETACGGHVVITSDTMADVLDSGKVAEYAHILHVGGHILSAPAPPPEPPTDKAEDLPHDENETAMNLVNSDQRTTVAEFDPTREDCAELFLLLPNPLLRRVFKLGQLKTHKQVSSGYFQAPAKDCVTICFTSANSITSLAADFPLESRAVLQMLCRCIRGSLARHQGYECEEHKGSFMLAFHSPNAALRCATEVQEELLKLPWPEDVLDHPSCQTWQLDGQVIFNGPRISVGIVSGNVVKKIPNPSTGRADYFGPLLNHTARVLSKAAPGQVLVDQNTWAQALDQAGDSLLGGVSLGEFQLKGLDEPVTLYQISREASMSALRPFPVRRKRRDFNNEIPFEVHIRVSEDEPRRNGSQQKVEGTARIVHRARTFLL